MGAARAIPAARFLLFAAAALPFFFLQTCRASKQSTSISPGFNAQQIEYIDNDGLFLLSPSNAFAFGFQKANPDNATSFLLVIIHKGDSGTGRVVWTANPDKPVRDSDKFSFANDGSATLSSGDQAVWSAKADGATQMQLTDSGNLVLRKGGAVNGSSVGGETLWQSFDHPTDTLLPEQIFKDGMALSVAADASKLSKWTYTLQVASGDVRLLATSPARQQHPYWSISRDKNKLDLVGVSPAGRVRSAAIANNSWEFYNDKGTKVIKLKVADAPGAGANASSLAIVLEPSGFISFYDFSSASTSPITRIPKSPCETPGSCGPYLTCSENGGTSSCGNCPTGLNCTADSQAQSLCNSGGAAPSEFVDLGLVRYNPTALESPTTKGGDLVACKASCKDNCSCRAAFFNGGTKECYLFDAVGSLQDEQRPGANIDSSSMVKTPLLNCSIKIDAKNGGGGSSNKPIGAIVGITFATTFVVAAVIFLGVWHFRRKGAMIPKAASRRDTSREGLVSSDEDDYLGSISGAPVRYTYDELVEATNNFSRKLGQGGFGSVYLGTLPDGSQIAVKKLESIGQGKKEFRAEVSIIGSIRHVHLVRLRGFCAEGTHRLLAYEFLANGSLDKWIFRRSAARSTGAISSSFASRSMGSSRGSGGVFQPQEELPELDWEKRFSIALGTAKGLAYLHEDCDSKIVHCDIKPENVLLDDHFQAKVSDFGLAKLMTREQSHVFTTMRGTRGYLAPEWITCAPISEKSDVYSYGIVLMELLAGRKNFEPRLTSEKAHLPTYAFRLMEEGKLNEVFDDSLRRMGDKDERVELAIKVALWCVQEDMAMRPSMSRVVQMLEGVAPVPTPPVSHTMGSRIHASAYKTFSDGTTSSSTIPSECNSDVLLSAVRLSGPR